MLDMMKFNINLHQFTIRKKSYLEIKF